MSRSDSRTRWATPVALLGAGAVAGIIGATAFGATAATTSGTPTTSSSAAPAAPSRSDHDRGFAGRGPGGDHGAPGEDSVSTAKAAALRAAALEHVAGGTVDRVETDSGDAAYEVHMTTASGKQVTVKFDKNLEFVAVEDGMGK